MRLAVFIVVILFLAGCEEEGFETVEIDGRAFRLELATDDASRTRGLMDRESIPDDGGMLFVFPEARVRSFWMSNCLIDIDIIFLDPQGRITAMHEMKAEPLKADNETQAEYEARLSHYWSSYPAQLVIELQAGTLDQLDLSVEDKIELRLDRLKQLAQ